MNLMHRCIIKKRKWEKIIIMENGDAIEKRFI